MFLLPFIVGSTLIRLEFNLCVCIKYKQSRYNVYCIFFRLSQKLTFHPPHWLTGHEAWLAIGRRAAAAIVSNLKKTSWRQNCAASTPESFKRRGLFKLPVVRPFIFYLVKKAKRKWEKKLCSREILIFHIAIQVYTSVQVLFVHWV